MNNIQRWCRVCKKMYTINLYDSIQKSTYIRVVCGNCKTVLMDTPEYRNLIQQIQNQWYDS